MTRLVVSGLGWAGAAAWLFLAVPAVPAAPASGGEARLTGTTDEQRLTAVALIVLLGGGSWVLARLRRAARQRPAQ
ncbi:MAG TPA: hypothetical protein VH092_08770 [Urbifossiella sp.]|nr:hypothetical protein [Urbifossiella sp.]